MTILDTHSLYKEFIKAGFNEQKSEVLSSAILQNSNTEQVDKLGHEQSDVKTSIALIKNDIGNIRSDIAMLKWMLPLYITLALGVLKYL